jgi:hypothetical protein
MLQYDPQHHLYPGNEGMRKSTQQGKARCKASTAKGGSLSDSEGSKRGTMSVTADNPGDASSGRDAQLGGNLSTLMRHINGRIYDKHGVQCVYCGLDSNCICDICKEWVHWYPKTGVAKDADCYMKYHDEEYFVLGRDDQVLFFKKRKNDWNPPNQTQRRANAQHVAILKTTEESEFRHRNQWSLGDKRGACGIIYVITHFSNIF